MLSNLPREISCDLPFYKKALIINETTVTFLVHRAVFRCSFWSDTLPHRSHNDFAEGRDDLGELGRIEPAANHQLQHLAEYGF